RVLLELGEVVGIPEVLLGEVGQRLPREPQDLAVPVADHLLQQRVGDPEERLGLLRRQWLRRLRTHDLSLLCFVRNPGGAALFACTRRGGSRASHVCPRGAARATLSPLPGPSGVARVSHGRGAGGEASRCRDALAEGFTI